MFQLNYLVLIVTIVNVFSEKVEVNYNLTQDDFKFLCEQIGSLVASGVDSESIAKIVTSEIISKLESTIKEDQLIKGKPGKQKPSSDDSDSETMTVYSEGFINYVTQIIWQLFNVENVMINVAYAENLNMILLGKRSTINSIDDGHQNHNLYRQEVNATEICSLIDFPANLPLDDQEETKKMLSKLATDAKNLIHQLFTSLKKSSTSSS